MAMPGKGDWGDIDRHMVYLGCTQDHCAHFKNSSVFPLLPADVAGPHPDAVRVS